MTRPLRVEYPNALYHVTSRGNEKKKIFLDDYDRKMFLETLSEVVKSDNLICHAYCLMGNHYHLLLETPEANLAHAMRDINGNYSQKFNWRHKRVGHLFQGRYKAFVIELESYLLEVARYVVLNPVRAKMVKHPRDWRWSSFRANAGLIKAPDWLHSDTVLRLFSKRIKDAQKLYRKFVLEGVSIDSPFDDVLEGVILGSQEFVDFIWKKTNGSENIKQILRSQRIVGRPSLKELFGKLSDRNERDLAIIFACGRCGYLISEIADYLGLDASTVGKIVRGKYNLKD